MKIERLSDMIKSYRHTTGSISYCTKIMRSDLEARGNTEAVERADVVAGFCKVARRMEYDRLQFNLADPMRRRGSRMWDARVDTTLSGLAKTPESFAELEGESHIKTMAVEFLEGLFPAGVGPVTSLPYQDQYAAVKEILSRLDGEFSEHVEVLGLTPIVEQLDTFNEQYGESLAGDDYGVSASEVEAARYDADEAFSKLLTKIMHDYMDDIEVLNRVLKPFFRQEERMRRHYQRRNSMPRVNPDTGEVLDDDDYSPLPVDGPVDEPVEPAEPIEPADDVVEG